MPAQQGVDTPLSAAGLIGSRLRQDALVEQAVAESERTAKNPFEWGGATLAKGRTGTALLYLALSRNSIGHQQQEWFTAAQEELRQAVATTHSHPLTMTSALLGSSGLLLAVEEFNESDSRYGGSARTLREQVAAQVLEHAWPERDNGFAATDYDVIGGAAGVLGALCALPGPLSAAVADARDLLVRYLVHSARPAENGHSQCFVTPELYPLEEYRAQYPHGYYNTGLSHGIPGVVSALAAARLSGTSEPGTADALRRLTDDLVQWSMTDTHGVDWPAGVPLTPEGRPDTRHPEPTRTAWCYGAPGVAVSLHQAADVLDDPGLRRLALDAFDSAMKRCGHGADVESPTLCHGLTGLLCVAHYFSHRSGDPRAVHATGELTRHVLAACDTGHLLVVRDEESPANFVDDPGFLTGAAGVGAALAMVAGGERPLWSSSLMLGW
ncbi:lanthionine synthetase C family protein [Streptomyces sp. NPDC006326]|uniref:lanthionine synthetase C family protein n=1 Tax=Streptomyces sp. NPDC006326 TaxID=3156752 RepID=UPI0033B94313